MPTLKCPICGLRFELGDSPSPPFCSARCRKIDLGRWLGESYAMPSLPDEDDPEEEPPPVEED